MLHDDDKKTKLLELAKNQKHLTNTLSSINSNMLDTQKTAEEIFGEIMACDNRQALSDILQPLGVDEKQLGTIFGELLYTQIENTAKGTLDDYTFKTSFLRSKNVLITLFSDLDHANQINNALEQKQHPIKKTIERIIEAQKERKESDEKQASIIPTSSKNILNTLKKLPPLPEKTNANKKTQSPRKEPPKEMISFKSTHKPQFDSFPEDQYTRILKKTKDNDVQKIIMKHQRALKAQFQHLKKNKNGASSDDVDELLMDAERLFKLIRSKTDADTLAAGYQEILKSSVSSAASLTQDTISSSSFANTTTTTTTTTTTSPNKEEQESEIKPSSQTNTTQDDSVKMEKQTSTNDPIKSSASHQTENLSIPITDMPESEINQQLESKEEVTSKFDDAESLIDKKVQADLSSTLDPNLKYSLGDKQFKSILEAFKNNKQITGMLEKYEHEIVFGFGISTSLKKIEDMFLQNNFPFKISKKDADILVEGYKKMLEAQNLVSQPEEDQSQISINTNKISSPSIDELSNDDSSSLIDKKVQADLSSTQDPNLKYSLGDKQFKNILEAFKNNKQITDMLEKYEHEIVFGFGISTSLEKIEDMFLQNNFPFKISKEDADVLVEGYKKMLEAQNLVSQPEEDKSQISINTNKISSPSIDELSNDDSSSSIDQKAQVDSSTTTTTTSSSKEEQESEIKSSQEEVSLIKTNSDSINSSTTSTETTVSDEISNNMAQSSDSNINNNDPTQSSKESLDDKETLNANNEISRTLDELMKMLDENKKENDTEENNQILSENDNDSILSKEKELDDLQALMDQLSANTNTSDNSNVLPSSSTSTSSFSVDKSSTSIKDTDSLGTDSLGTTSHDENNITLKKTDLVIEPPIESPIEPPKLQTLSDDDAINLAKALHELNQFMKKNSFKDINKKDNKGNEFESKVTKLRELIKNDHDHPLYKMLEIHTMEKEQYEKLKTDAKGLEKYHFDTSNKGGTFFQKRSIDEITEKVGRLIAESDEQVPTRLGWKYAEKYTNDCKYYIHVINIDLGRMLQNEAKYAEEIDMLKKQRGLLIEQIADIKQMKENKEVRTYARTENAKIISLSGSHAEQIEAIFREFNISTKSLRKPDRAGGVEATGIKPYKSTALKDNEFRVDPSRKYALPDKKSLDIYKEHNPEDTRNDHEINFEIRTGIGNIDGVYTGLIRYGDAFDWMSDEQIMEVAARFMEEVHAGLGPRDRGKKFEFIEGTHPRFVQAGYTYCDLSGGRIQRPILPDDVSKPDKKYITAMQKHLRKEQTIDNIKQSTYLPITSEQRRKERKNQQKNEKKLPDKSPGKSM